MVAGLDSTNAAITETSLELTVRKLERAHRSRLRHEMRECFHDEAWIESIAAGKALGPDGVVSAILAAFDDGVYAMSSWEIVTLADEVVLAWASVRHRAHDNVKRISTRTNYWLVSGRDNLMWRVKLFDDGEAAKQHFAEHGHTLGINAR